MHLIDETTTHPARILIVDDHPAVREGLANRISRQADMEVCGEACDGPDAIALVVTSLPDVAIVDITLKTGSGIDLIKQLKDLNPSVRVLVWSMHVDSVYAERALRGGADGYINKEEATEHVIEAIREVLAGKLALNPSIVDQLMRRSIGGHPQSTGITPVELLSDRELETYRLIGEGLSTREISIRMNTHLRTVETYLARTKKKFNFVSRQQLIHAASQWVLENR